MKIITAEEYLKNISDTKLKIMTEKLGKYNDFKEKFGTEFNQKAEEASFLLKEEFEVEYHCKITMEPYINMFCLEIENDFEKIEMYYDDEDEEEENNKKNKKNSEGFFVIVFALKKSNENSN